MQNISVATLGDLKNAMIASGRLPKSTGMAQGEEPVELREETVMLPRGKQFLLRISFPRSILPKDLGNNDVQLHELPPAPAITHNREGEKDDRQVYKNTIIDLKSLLETVSVLSMNVVGNDKQCVLYIKCEEVGNEKGKLGFDTWGNNAYGALARRLFRWTWSRTVFESDKKNERGHSSITLRNSSSGLQSETKIFFAIAPSAAE